MINIIIKALSVEAQTLGFIIPANMIYFDDSRSWSLYTPGYVIGVNVNKFGAYRDYNGGGVRGPIQHNGREQDNTKKLGELFQKTLLKIESLINSGYEDADPWDLPTGVLM